MKIKISIKNRWTGKVIFELESENNTIKNTLLEAIKADSDLRDSDLRDSNLRDSDLRGSDLRGSDLSGSDLRDSDLRDSNLSGSDLSGSDLRGSNLRDSDLRDSNLRGSNLSPIKSDFFMILLYAKNEVLGLRDALINGKIDGYTYSGECACLVGTIANAKHCNYEKIPGIIPDSNRPSERWFLGISKGCTPENNQTAKITLEWIDEFLSLIS